MIELAHTLYESDNAGATPLIIVPGLFGAGRNWRAHAKRMAANRPVFTVDMRNHGESPWSDEHDYPAMAGDLAGFIEAQGGRAQVLGHSMGGKAAMLLAETRPELIERLIVADIAPVPYEHDLMAEIDAMRAVDLTSITRRAEVEEALAAHIDAAPVRSFLAQSALIDENKWSLNLDALAANMKLITGYPVEVEGVYEGPTLFIYGGASDYVQPEHDEEIRARFPNVEMHEMEGAGHWLHADQPRAFLNAVLGFTA